MDTAEQWQTNEPERRTIQWEKESKRSGKVFRQNLRLLRKTSRAAPIPNLRRFPRVLNKSFDLGHQVGLRRVQPLSIGGHQVFLGDCETLIRLLLCKSRLSRS